MLAVKLTGLAQYLPQNKIYSTDLDTQLGLPPQTVQKKSGLLSRHFANKEETTSYMAAQAAFKALHNARCSLDDIDVIITDAGIPEIYKEKLEERGIEVVIV